MNRFGFSWPESLKCSRFPEPSFEQSCVSRVTESEVIISPSPPSINTQLPVTGISSVRECEPISVPLCRDLPYNTSFPNIFNHDSQEEAGLEIHQFFPLIKMQCSLDLQLFLCSVYVPVCTIMREPILPCKSLCKSARHGCEELMSSYGFSWPESLECSRFPELSHGQPCVSRVTDGEVIISPSPPIGSTQLPLTGISTKAECEHISVPLCRDLPYNTSFPNIFNHDGQEEAGLEIHQFYPLIEIQCSLDLQLFLCSVYVPVCIEREEPILPCRSLCESSRHGCEKLMNRFGFSWPESLKCSRFPEPSFEQSCVSRVTESEVIISPSPPSINTQLPVTGISSVRECEPISVPLCRDLPYNNTRFPNIFNHDSQEEAGLEIHQFFPLIKMQCSLDLQLFLCFVYVPVCTIMEEPILPCKSLCESARHGCEELMNSYGFSWPESLECSRFPELSHGQLCVS
ncbi:atrial natriuretic peptide-converting enzyme-like [Macrobrachium nipponense]|uniref:atrial natriuretic peptide-converting enzyme-like n=1 Tax=Macrobrachium nipponense TaxID=159736 RepID=UPI0030C87DAD